MRRIKLSIEVMSGLTTPPIDVKIKAIKGAADRRPAHDEFKMTDPCG